MKEERIEEVQKQIHVLETDIEYHDGAEPGYGVDVFVKV